MIPILSFTGFTGKLNTGIHPLEQLQHQYYFKSSDWGG